MNPSTSRTIKLLGAMGLGLLFPAAHPYQFLIRYLIALMLWMAFLDIRLAGFQRQHLWILGANWLIGLGAWLILLPFNRELALAGLLIGLTPSATASPVITGMLGGRVEFVAASVLLTNAAAGLLLPLVLPLLLGTQLSIPLGSMSLQTAGVVLLPLAAAQVFRLAAPAATKTILAWRGLTFYAWLAVLFLVTANASHFLRTSVHGLGMATAIALLSALLCALNFWVGRKIGGKTLAQEASQSLGQKNTILTIWIALTFLNPLVALGPTFYILCHNSYNAWQLARYKVRE